MNAVARRRAGARIPPPIAGGYVVVSTAIAAVALLTTATYSNALYLLVLVTFPISVPAYAFTALATILLDAPDKDYMAARVLCFVAWTALIIVQAAIGHFGLQHARRHTALRKESAGS